jgi:hypothetical protein
VARAAGKLVVEEGTHEDGKVTEPANPSNQEQAVENGSTTQETVNDEISEDATADAADETPNQEGRAEQDRPSSPHTAQPDNAGRGSGGKPPEAAEVSEGGDESKTLSYEEYMEQASSFIEFADDGTIRLLDPITGAPIVGDAIPESLQADSELSKGYEFLARNGYRVDMRLLLSPHDTSTNMTDAGIDLHAEAAQLAKQGGVLFFEGVSKDFAVKNAFWQRYIKASNAAGASISEARQRLEQRQQSYAAKYGKTAFGIEAVTQLLGTHVEIALPDYVQDSRNPADHALNKMDELFSKTIRSATASDQVKAHHAFVAVGAAFVRYRDQYLVGSMGRYLSLRPPRSEGLIHTDLVTGSYHRNIGSYLNSLGVAHVAYVGKDIRTQYPAGENHAPNAIEGSRKGIFTKENLDDITWKW